MNGVVPKLTYSFENTDVAPEVNDATLEQVKQFLQRDGMNAPQKISYVGHAKYAEANQYSLALHYDNQSKVTKATCERIAKHTDVYNYEVIYHESSMELVIYLYVTVEKYKEVPDDAKEQIKIIRKWLKRLDKGLSVRMARGTAWGWVDISGNATEFGEFTEAQKEILRNVGINPGGNFALINPESRKEWTRKAMKGTK